MKTASQQKMYDNAILEILSVSGPKMMITFHLTIIILCLINGYLLLGQSTPVIKLCLFFFSGIAFWSLAEYILHRHLFHFESENRFLKAFHFAMHGYHHENPLDIKRLFMPPVPALIFLTIFLGIYYLLMGNYAWFFLPGFELGYLAYSFVHYSIHKSNSPKKLAKLRHHHILHHYKFPDKAYGVSTTIWDRIFKTMPENKRES